MMTDIERAVYQKTVEITERLQKKIPEELFNQVMDEMKRDGNCGILTCCMECVERMAEAYMDRFD